MTRLPHVDSARRLFRDAATGFHRPGRLAHAAATIGFGLARSEEHTSALQSHRDLHSFPTRRSSDLRTLIPLAVCFVTPPPAFTGRAASHTPPQRSGLVS